MAATRTEVLATKGHSTCVEAPAQRPQIRVLRLYYVNPNRKNCHQANVKGSLCVPLEGTVAWLAPPQIANEKLDRAGRGAELPDQWPGLFLQSAAPVPSAAATCSKSVRNCAFVSGDQR